MQAFLVNTLLVLPLLLLLIANQPHVVRGYNLDAQKALVKLGPRGSKFGYSIAQHATFDPANANSTFKSTILVGAPTADASRILGVVKPGAVYKCDFSSTSSCQQVEIDSLIPINPTPAALSTSGDQRQSSKLWESSSEPTVLRDNQWLGVSVKSQGPNGFAVACAHRYVLKGPDYRWAQGICYSLTKNLTLHKTWQPCYNRPVNRMHEEYGYCQAGTSSDISESSDIVIGSPGPYTWRGTVFTNSVNFSAKEDKTWYMAPVIDRLAKVQLYSYLGMSVISGKFFHKQQYYVSGAIRSNGTGQVLFLTKQTQPKGESNFKTDLILSGEQYGSGFGYSLAKLDLNGDGQLDLAVAAPFYFTASEGGAVYIYSNDAGKTLSLSSRLTGKPNSRFGFALANAGDLNKDKFDDLAIGAPYESHGGAVYIFSGSANGIKQTPSQVIKASTVAANLQTFGYSLSGGLDMDRNGYPDLAVGSYADDSVFILRARPIIEIVTKIEGNLTKIDPNKTLCDGERSPLPCFKFNTCFELDPAAIGEYSDSMKLKYRIEAETFNGQKFTRVQFQESENSDTPNIVEKEILIEDYYRGMKLKRCSPQRVYIKDKSDIQTPIDFKLTYSLVPPTHSKSSTNSQKFYQNNGGDDLTPPFPILNQDEAQRIFSARFLKDCGPNDICESHLDVDGSLQLPRETLGVNEAGYMTDKQINVTIRVANSQEPAYDADLYVRHPASLTYSGFKSIKQVSIVECASIDKTLVKCELGNPMTKGTTKLLMVFATQNQAGDFDFNLAVNTTSQNSRDARTSFDLSGTIKKKAELLIKPRPPVTFPEHQNQEPPFWVLFLAIILGLLLFSGVFWCLYINGFFERSKAPYRPTDTEERFN